MSKILSLPRGPRADPAALLSAIVDSSFDAIVSKDLNSEITSWNNAAERLFGYTAEEAVGQSVLLLIPEGRHDEEKDIIERIRCGERVASFETRRRRKDGDLIDVSLTISPIRDSGGEIIGASKIARDITATRESERRIRLLMREVNHRVKNQFSVILSIIRETSKRTSDPGEFEASVRERIMALAKSHDLLVATDWKGTSMFDLVQEHLQPFGHEDRITLSGPLLMLQANAVQNLGMAIHELGTNSAKYGALAREAGSVDVSWRVVGTVAGDREMELTWEEKSIPSPSSTPTDRNRGFGTVVLKMVAPTALSGRASLDRSPGHVRWVLAAPIKNIAADFDGGSAAE